MLRSNRGFTLIELLVVIAIIGILSSVVLASLTTARSKGKDAAVQSQMSSIRAQAELYYSTNSNYGTATTVCNNLFASSTANGAGKLIDGVYSQGVTPACIVTGSPSSSWVVAAALPSDSTKFFCVDSAGNAIATTTATLTAAIACK